MKCFKRITLFLAASMMLPVLSFAQDNQPQMDANVTSAVKTGLYEPYNFGNRFRVTSTLLANPSRLETVNFAGVYEASAVSESLDSSSAVEFVDNLQTGTIAAAFKDEAGNLLVNQAFSEKLSSQIVIKAAGACSESSDLECVREVRGSLTDFLKDSGYQIQEVKFLASSPNAIEGEPEQKVINWNRPSFVER